MTSSERVGMVWQITCDAWAFAGRRDDLPARKRAVGRPKGKADADALIRKAPHHG